MVKRVPWCLVHPRLVLVTIRPTCLVLVTIGLLNFSTHIFLVPMSFSPQIFRPPLGAGVLIVTCDSWSTLLWQLVHPSYIVNWGTNVTRSLVADLQLFLSADFAENFRECPQWQKQKSRFFCFSVRWKATKIFAFKYFRVFLAVHVCLTSEDYRIFPVHWTEHREFESADFAENFRECPQWQKQKSRFFLFLCKMKGNKDICIWIFLSFLAVFVWPPRITKLFQCIE